MMIKVLTAAVLSAALYVAGDATIQQFGCYFQCPFCCTSSTSCAEPAPPKVTRPRSDCCTPQSDCCANKESCCENDK